MLDPTQVPWFSAIFGWKGLQFGKFFNFLWKSHVFFDTDSNENILESEFKGSNMPIRAVGERSRSPRYPSHSLPQAIEFVKRVYQGIHRSPVDSLTMLRVMGFAGKSGASATALGSMRQYGLIQGFADNTRVSDLALSILEPISEEERVNAIRKAGESPAVFNQILERFGGKLPNSADALRAYLIRELGFSSGGARDCITAITGTQEYLATLGASSVQPQEADSPENPAGANLTALQTVSATEFSAKGETDSSETIILRLTKDCRVELRFFGTVSGKALTALQRHINLMSELWAEE